MIIEKNYLLKSKIVDVWKFISNPELLCKCIPNLEDYKKINEKHFTITVKPNFTFLQTKVLMDWKIISLGKNQGKLNIKGSAIGSTFDAITELKVLKKNGNALLKWRVNLKKITGLIKPVPETIIRATALKLADDIFNCIDSKIRN